MLQAIIISIPIAIFLIWKIFDAQQSTRSTSVLGLTDSNVSGSNLDLIEHQTHYLRVLYVVTGGLTFVLGVLSFHAFMFLQEIARSLLA